MKWNTQPPQAERASHAAAGAEIDMRWWEEPSLSSHINETRSHLHAATQAPGSATSACDSYFKGLNRLWNAYALHQGEPRRADTPSFISLLRAIRSDLHPTLLDSDALRRLVALAPEVMDHAVLKSHGYRPGQEISTSLRRDATEKHRTLRNGLAALSSSPPGTTADKVLKKLAEFLYVIRLNIAHGEKVPYGPDLEKAKRDKEVCALAAPLLALLCDLLFERPVSPSGR